MKTFVINLDEATDRLKHYSGTNAHRWSATHYNAVRDEDAKRMISYHNVPKKNHLCKTACFISHLLLWEHIVKHKLNSVLILEDDAMKRNFNFIGGFPQDGITYLGGATYTPLMTGKFIEVDLKEGINKIDFEKYRMLMTMSYHIPTYEIAQKLIDMVMNRRRWRAVDVMLGDIQKNEHLEAYVYYPAVYTERPNESQIQTKSRNKFASIYYTLEPKDAGNRVHMKRCNDLILLGSS